MDQLSKHFVWRENGGRGIVGKERMRKIIGDKKEEQKKKDNDNDEGQYNALT